FTLYLPIAYKEGAIKAVSEKQQQETIHLPSPSGEPAMPISVPDLSLVRQSEVEDDRDNIQPSDRVLLIVEDYAPFAGSLLEVAHQAGFKGLIALRANTALVLAKKIGPAAITLDLKLPDMDGWALLDLLKHDPDTRHIPLWVVSGGDHRERALRMGAFGYLEKPTHKDALGQALSSMRDFAARDYRNLLIVEGDAIETVEIVALLGGSDIRTVTVRSGKDALAALAAESFDCVLADRKFNDMSALDLAEKICATERSPNLPVVIYGKTALTKKDLGRIAKLSPWLVVRRATSAQELLNETTLLLHRSLQTLPGDQRELIESAQRVPAELAGKKVLVVDDDIRNIFALTSVLEQHGMTVVYAENGKDGITLLESTQDIEVVLMDVMMPEMDGYDTMRIIRKLDEFKDLPMIALTAKAMKGDREKCIEAGASDYIAKPVNIEQLISLLRVCLTH
ncbi:MAG: response regulator, partial [Gammaproteobacteria bacterium]